MNCGTTTRSKNWSPLVNCPRQSSPDHNFVDAIMGRDEVHSSGEGGLDVLRVNEACWESARTGKEVAVALPDGGSSG